MDKNSIDKSKLIQLISYLDDKDFKELGLWVRSPIHNSAQIVIDLYDVIKHKYRNTDKPIDMLYLMKGLKMSPRTAREKDICPRDKQELRRAMHLLSEQIEDFLIWKANQKEAVVRKRHLMDELIIRRAYPLVPAVMRKARKLQKTSPLRDIKHCKNEYLLAEMDLFMTVILKKDNAATDMQLTVDALCQYSISLLLCYYGFSISTQEIFKTDYSYPILEMLASHISKSEYIKHYTIRFYYTLLKLIKEKQVEDYDKLKIMIASQNTFPGHELRQIFTLLINFCIDKINQGDDRFTKERFDLYKEALRRGILTNDVQFSPRKFNQIVYSALLANQPEWADDFIEQYSHELGPDVRENTVNYSKALCAFHVGKYDVAQDFLYAIDKVLNVSIRIHIKILLIKIYYDKNDLNFHNIDTHPINSELEALRQLTRPGNNIKLTEDTRLPYANFANFLKRILNRKKKIIEKQAPIRQNIEALKAELSEIQFLTHRKWLSDKLEELMSMIKD